MNTNANEDDSFWADYEAYLDWLDKQEIENEFYSCQAPRTVPSTDGSQAEVERVA